MVDLEALVECSECNERIRKPHMIPACGHQFCGECGTDALAATGSCPFPNCEVPCYARELKPDPALASVIEAMANLIAFEQADAADQKQCSLSPVGRMNSASSADASPAVSGVSRVAPSQPSAAKQAAAAAAATLISAPRLSRPSSSKGRGAGAAVVATDPRDVVTAALPSGGPGRSSRRSTAAAASSTIKGATTGCACHKAKCDQCKSCKATHCLCDGSTSTGGRLKKKSIGKQKQQDPGEEKEKEDVRAAAATAAAATIAKKDGKKSSSSSKSTPYNRKRPDTRRETKGGSKRSRSIGSASSTSSTSTLSTTMSTTSASRPSTRTPLGRVNQAEPPNTGTAGGRKRKAAAATTPTTSTAATATTTTTTTTPSNTRARQSGSFRTPAPPAAAGGGTGCPLSAGQLKNKDKRNGNGETPLHKASIKGDLATVVAYIDANADVNTKCNAKWTPLHEVCSHGHVALVAPLLEARANVNMPGGGIDRNCTALHDAVQNGHADIVEMLLSVGNAKVDVLDADGKLPKDLTDDPHIMQLLEMGGSDRGQMQPRRCKVLNTSDRMDLAVGGSGGGGSGGGGGGNQPASIVITGISNDAEKKAVIANAKKLGLAVLTELSPAVTHLVTPVDATPSRQCRRTYKYMCAILMGKRIVSPAWLTASVRKKELVDESEFEPLSDGKCEITNFNSNGPIMNLLANTGQGKRAAVKGFLTKLTGQPSLFDSCSFFFKGDFTSPSDKLPRDKLQKLVELGNGEVLAREPREMTRWVSLPHAVEPKKFKSPTFIVVGGAKKNQVRESGIHEITGSYLLQCISNFALDDPSMPVAVMRA